MSSPGIKNILLHNSGNQNYNFARLAPTRGAYHDRHDTWGAGCDGRFGVRRFLTPDENAKAYGEVVWSWRRDAGAKSAGSVPPATVTTSPLHRGERDISRKAIAQGMSDCSAEPVCSCAPFLRTLAHETAGAACTRHSLRPRFSREAKEFASLGRNRAARSRTHILSARRPCESRDPYAAAEIVWKKWSTALLQQQPTVAIWVPAFAGTTERCQLAASSRSSVNSRIAASASIGS